MQWWEEKKHVLVREKARLNDLYPNNDFVFQTRDNALWLTGELLDFFEFECRYPPSYPSAPPDIFPKDRSTTWVPEHQYKSDSRFCLDIREKTWNSTLSATDIIRSLEVLLVDAGIKLIKKENSLRVPEEQEPTDLQRKLQRTKCIVPSDIDFPSDQSFGTLKYFFLVKPDTYRVVIAAVVQNDKDIESSLVKGIWEAESFSSKLKGLWIRTSSANIDEILEASGFDELDQLLRDKGIISKEATLLNLAPKAKCIRLLLVDQDNPHTYSYIKCDVETKKNEPYGAYVIDPKNIFDRIPNKGDYEVLNHRKVTIIGCGSVGSKVAEYLVKAGVGNFTLVDGELLTTENVMRHACQLDDVGIEKVYAVRNRLRRANPEVRVHPIVKHVDAIDTSVHEVIKDSNVIVVATALNEGLFNEYAYRRDIPAVYSKVYPFGFGGEVLRIVPGVTPCFECTCCCVDDGIKKQFPNAVFPETETRTYDETSDGQQIPIPALAIDADFITLITAKMALEILTVDDQRSLKGAPHVILWGNSRGWIFDQQYQSFQMTDESLASFKNCRVCYRDKVIEDELGISNEQIEDEYTKIVSEFKSEGQRQTPG